MALEYRQLVMTESSFISESELPGRLSYRNRNKMSPEELLKEEIYILRTLMEKTAENEQSFTSEMVVRISSLLDKKINEYYRLTIDK